MLFVLSSMNAQANKLKLSVGISSDYSSRNISPSDSFSYAVAQKYGLEVVKYGKISYSIYANLIYKFNSHFELLTGVGYNNKGYNTRYKPLTFTPRYYTVKQNYHYLYIPFQLYYIKPHNQYKLISSLGFNLDYLLSASSLSYQHGQRFQTKTILDKTPYEKFNITPIASLGIETQIKSQTFRIELLAQYSLLTNIRNKPYKEYLYGTGFKLSYLFPGRN